MSDNQNTFSQLSLEQYLGNNPIMRRWILARGPLSCICSCPSSPSALRETSVSPMLHTIPVTRPSSCSEPDECTACRSWRMLMKTSTWDTTKCKTCNENTLLLGITNKHVTQRYACWPFRFQKPKGECDGVDWTSPYQAIKGPIGAVQCSGRNHRNCVGYGAFHQSG